jgi:hypothetical protein
VKNKITQLDNQGKALKINAVSSKGNTYNMDAYEMSRWCAMLEAVEVIDKKLSQLKTPAADNWVKPIAMQKYVDEKYQDILHDMIN